VVWGPGGETRPATRLCSALRSVDGNNYRDADLGTQSEQLRGEHVVLAGATVREIPHEIEVRLLDVSTTDNRGKVFAVGLHEADRVLDLGRDMAAILWADLYEEAARIKARTVGLRPRESGIARTEGLIRGQGEARETLPWVKVFAKHSQDTRHLLLQLHNGGRNWAAAKDVP